jgi:hypothetical protein
MQVKSMLERRLRRDEELNNNQEVKVVMLLISVTFSKD